MKLRYQRPRRQQLEEESSGSQNGRSTIELGTNEAIVAASLYCENPQPKVFANIYIERVRGTGVWSSFLDSGYIWQTNGTNKKGKGIYWRGFEYPADTFEVVFETGFLNKAWPVDDYHFAYQTAIVLEEDD